MESTRNVKNIYIITTDNECLLFLKVSKLILNGLICRDARGEQWVVLPEEVKALLKQKEDYSNKPLVAVWKVLGI